MTYTILLPEDIRKYILDLDIILSIYLNISVLKFRKLLLSKTDDRFLDDDTLFNDYIFMVYASVINDISSKKDVTIGILIVSFSKMFFEDNERLQILFSNNIDTLFNNKSNHLEHIDPEIQYHLQNLFYRK